MVRCAGNPWATALGMPRIARGYPIHERHNALGLDVRNMAREATLRANNEQRTVELPLGDPEEGGEDNPRRRPTRRAGIRIEAAGGSPATFIDVAVHCSVEACRSYPHPMKKGASVRQGENES